MHLETHKPRKTSDKTDPYPSLKKSHTVLSMRQVPSASPMPPTFLAFLREKLLTQRAAAIANRTLKNFKPDEHVCLHLMAAVFTHVSHVHNFMFGLVLVFICNLF